jgi:hypothetical protein
MQDIFNPYSVLCIAAYRRPAQSTAAAALDSPTSTWYSSGSSIPITHYW